MLTELLCAITEAGVTVAEEIDLEDGRLVHMLDQLKANNRTWSEAKVRADPQFFRRLQETNS
jgi:hypothetical protein